MHMNIKAVTMNMCLFRDQDQIASLTTPSLQKRKQPLVTYICKRTLDGNLKCKVLQYTCLTSL